MCSVGGAAEWRGGAGGSVEGWRWWWHGGVEGVAAWQLGSGDMAGGEREHGMRRGKMK